MSSFSGTTGPVSTGRLSGGGGGSLRGSGVSLSGVVSGAESGAPLSVGPASVGGIDDGAPPVKSARKNSQKNLSEVCLIGRCFVYLFCCWHVEVNTLLLHYY